MVKTQLAWVDSSISRAKSGGKGPFKKGRVKIPAPDVSGHEPYMPELLHAKDIAHKWPSSTVGGPYYPAFTAVSSDRAVKRVRNPKPPRDKSLGGAKADDDPEWIAHIPKGNYYPQARMHPVAHSEAYNAYMRKTRAAVRKSQRPTKIPNPLNRQAEDPDEFGVAQIPSQNLAYPDTSVTGKGFQKMRRIACSHFPHVFKD
jgi:hypothetical protein